jgi:sterol desaturase/sphingolipid hydroxylase (fatty acid hydroxylase superfamily)
MTLSSMAIDVVRLSVWLLLLALLFVPIEWLFSLHERRGRWRFADLAYYFLNSLLPGVIIAPIMATVAVLLTKVTPSFYTAGIAALPFAAKLVAALLVSEVGAYWAHRWCHEVPFLWRFHAIHHSAEHIDWLVNTRAHPLDIVFVRLCGLVPVYALGLASTQASGADAMIPVYVTLVGTVWSFLVHANVRWRFGWLEQVAATPAFHHWHHTNGAEGRDRNYAAMFPWIDRLFGTLHLPNDRWPPVYGIDRPIEGGIAAELLHPFRHEAAAEGQGRPDKV